MPTIVRFFQWCDNTTVSLRQIQDAGQSDPLFP